MASIFENWNKAFDTEAIQKDVQEAHDNNGTGEYEDVPFGKYEVKVEKMEIKASKKGDPMLSVWFKIISGDQENRLIFLNQVITQGFQIDIANQFLESLGTGILVEFKDYVQYNDMVLDIHEKIDGKSEYLVEYDQNKKGYSFIKVIEIYDVE